MKRPLHLGLAGHRGFSLLEVILVVAMVGVLLAVAAPSLIGTQPSHRIASEQIRSVVQHARSRAQRGTGAVYLVFADGEAPATMAYRAFVLYDASYDESGNEGTPVQASEWFYLPRGLIWGHGRDFPVKEGNFFGTILDGKTRSPFPIKTEHGRRRVVELPYIKLSSSGELIEPPCYQASNRHIGVVRGHFDESGRVRTFRTPQSREPRGVVCLKLSAYTGTITDIMP